MKVAVAAQLKKNTEVSNGWLGEQLKMGSACLRQQNMSG
jgi:hypothetical protein